MPTKPAATSKSSRKSAAVARPPVAVPDPPAAAAAPALDPQTRDAMVRIAAYTFYERRGFVGGHELEDWLQAEMEVDRQLAATGAAPKPEPPK